MKLFRWNQLVIIKYNYIYIYLRFYIILYNYYA